MRHLINSVYDNMQNNELNNITYYDSAGKHLKSYKDFYFDIELTISRIKWIEYISNKNINVIGILGSTSYQWMVIDHACIKGGLFSVAIPELYPSQTIDRIIKENKIDILLCDYNFRNILIDINAVTYYFNCDEDCPMDFEKLNTFDRIPDYNNQILENYSIAYSSGTSSNIKPIVLSFHPIIHEYSYLDELLTVYTSSRLLLFFDSLFNMNQKYRKLFRKYIVLASYKLSFWSRKDNKVIIFMPFSHPVQRSIVIKSFLLNINIIISNYKDSIKHLVSEKPNIMFSVPPVYESISMLIKQRIMKFNVLQKYAFWIFNSLKINAMGNGNVIKMIFMFTLFKRIRTLYGGKADLFITGSSPINREALEIFYSIGVLVLEAYAQSESFGTMNTPRNFKLGSVGKPGQGMIKIADDGEILLKYMERYHKKNHDILNINDGWIHTGDLGYLDSDHFLFIQGRKDDIIVLKSGKKINPYVIERLLSKTGLFYYAVVFTKNELDITAILKLKDSSIINSLQIQDCIKRVNESLPVYEYIKSYILVDEAHNNSSVSTGTLKPIRREIIKLYFNNTVSHII